MSKHTPGPWTVIDQDESTINVRGPDEEFVADVADGFYNESGYVRGYEVEANARLIAAAPDLLACLQRTVRFWDQLNTNDIKTMRALIARATGEAE